MLLYERNCEFQELGPEKQMLDGYSFDRLEDRDIPELGGHDRFDAATRDDRLPAISVNLALDRSRSLCCSAAPTVLTHTSLFTSTKSKENQEV